MLGIILAAGYATRLYPLTLDRPKALLPVNGRPIIDYIVDEMNTLDDLESIVIISNHRFYGHFSEWAATRGASALRAGRSEPPLVVLNDGTTHEDDRLGAIGDIQFVLDRVKTGDDLLVIASDNLFTYRLRDAWLHFRQHGEDMILAQQLPADQNLSRFAIAQLDASGLVVGLEEKPAKPKTNLAVYATYFYRADTLPLIGEYLEQGNPPDAPGYFPAWLYTRKPVRCYLFDGECYDIGTPEAYADVMTRFPVSAHGEHPVTTNAH
jgi:glucose-1-phosphate thymidylyltransferase